MAPTNHTTAVARTFEVTLGVAIVVITVLGVLAPLAGPAALGIGTGPLFGASPSVDATLDARSVAITTDPRLPALSGEVADGDGVEFLVPTGTRVIVYEPDLVQRLAHVGVPVLSALLAIGVLLLLLAITRTLRQGDPFVHDNARRLYAIAALVGIGGQALAVLGGFGRLAILDHPTVAPFVVPELDLTFTPLLVGLGVAVLAEIFRQGTVLRDDVEGLV